MVQKATLRKYDKDKTSASHCPSARCSYRESSDAEARAGLCGLLRSPVGPTSSPRSRRSCLRPGVGISAGFSRAWSFWMKSKQRTGRPRVAIEEGGGRGPGLLLVASPKP